ncbi:DUF3422 family protein [Colwellia psychrerythraea]|uniref:Uncharacterized protein n=1 Tax=Colwellia psychrerythraea (strain 34H / ATCC BAA-681) TaxID=167879 RepID=Q483L1_COLP3|nr:hypothetical protein CPS_2027 [Colwellia psychrerythraea 34H]
MFLHQYGDSHVAELIHLQEVCQRYSVSLPANDSVCFYQKIGEFEIRWERHIEFSSYT